MPQDHLTVEERYQITYLHMAGFANAQIAGHLGRHRATIGRELSRNQDRLGSYHYLSAQPLCDQRRSKASQRYKLDDSPLGQVVQERLGQRWSPQQIAGRLKMQNPANPARHVSHETIYRWIYRRHTQGEQWYEQLRRRHPRRRRRIIGERTGKRGQIPGRVGIEQRPASVAGRRRFGHWESDTLEGRKGSGVLVTHVERKSRIVRVGRLADKRAAGLSAVSCSMLADLPPKLRRTLTVDNGKEFADFKTMERKLNLKVYFANPHSPWERGTNENTNGLLRDYFPKGSDFRAITDRQLAQVEKMLNNRPRKCLNYRTPNEVLTVLPGVALRN